MLDEFDISRENSRTMIAWEPFDLSLLWLQGNICRIFGLSPFDHVVFGIFQFFIAIVPVDFLLVLDLVFGLASWWPAASETKREALGQRKLHINVLLPSTRLGRLWDFQWTVIFVLIVLILLVDDIFVFRNVVTILIVWIFCGNVIS